MCAIAAATAAASVAVMLCIIRANRWKVKFVSLVCMRMEQKQSECSVREYGSIGAKFTERTETETDYMSEEWRGAPGDASIEIKQKRRAAKEKKSKTIEE